MSDADTVREWIEDAVEHDDHRDHEAALASLSRLVGRIDDLERVLRNLQYGAAAECGAEKPGGET